MLNAVLPDSPNILFMKYEDIKKDVLKAVKKVAEFMGCDIDPDHAKTIANQVDFDYMNESFDMLEVMGKYHKPGVVGHFRKGNVGNWRNLFSEEQSARMDAMYHKKLVGNGLEFDFG